MPRITFMFCFFLLQHHSISAPFHSGKETSKFWVFFKDKKGVSFDPFSRFDPKTIERRIRYGIPLYDSTDFPLNPEYIHAVRQLSDSCGKQSRWLNAMVIFASEENAQTISHLPFIESVEKRIYNARLAGNGIDNYSINESDSGRLSLLLKDYAVSDSILLANQILHMQGNLFAKKEIDGKGIRIAVFDAGFPYVNTHPAYEHIRKEKRILKTYDFVSGNENVYGHNSHGAMVLSCIAGRINGQNIGVATGAEFLLARTEQATGEPFSEEENWLVAAEWADQNGADIISSSLGYTFNRYFQEQMDGSTSLVTRSANMAARKGMLVVNAAGNDGDNKWKFLGAPADADSVLTVGGVSPVTGFHISFSSFGPTADKRLKPNVIAYGSVIAASKKGLEHVFGTSFSTPLVSGFAACAWQLNRDMNNMQLFELLEKSGHLYPYFDYANGYGIPQASYFTDSIKIPADTSFSFVKEGNTLRVTIRKEYLDSNEKAYNLLYYHRENRRNYLDKYAVINVYDENPVEFNMDDFEKGEKVMVYFRNYTAEYVFL